MAHYLCQKSQNVAVSNTPSRARLSRQYIGALATPCKVPTPTYV
jgi:hypothetical protein